jgi:hypothetical protein
MLWLGAARFGDDGQFFLKQERNSVANSWTRCDFAKTYLDWANDETASRQA